MTTHTALEGPDLYTIGWIAALPIERAAAAALLDELHDEPHGFSRHPNDHNAYTWGRMGKHNIVIASLAAGLFGTTSAATTALKLLSSLPQIKIGLLVGIGGGIPRPDEGRDIRLGDIVVSKPDGATGGVVQYDFAKSKPNNKHERKDFLNMPPPVLLHALGKLQAEHEFEEPMMPKFLSKMLRDKPRMAKSRHGYVHQGFENDRLFQASYQHAGTLDCLSCDPNEQVRRDMRDSNDPEIHYGIIASGNTLVKDAAARDKIVEHIGENCLCVEMEAAGLMNHFPCLVIRGICDYADSHKNDSWQRYASATAAAFAKELLSYVPTRGLEETQRAVELLQSIETATQSIHEVTRLTNTAVDSLLSDSYAHKISKWLSPPNTSVNRNTAKEKRLRGSGDWFITSTVFLEWKSGLRRHLWLHGLVGCGKTVLTSTILDHTCLQDDSHICIWFFFDFRDKNKQHLDDLLRSLAFQLSSQCADTREQLNNLFASCRDGKEQPSTELLSITIDKMMRSGKKIRIILDALDECLTRGDLLRWMETLSSPELTNVHLLATSRREEELESGLSKWIQEDDMVLMNRDNVSDDICSYIRARLQHGEQFQKRWASNPSVLEEIESTIGEKADGMFRWAACQLDSLEHCLDYQEIRDALRSLPKTLEETYSRILMDIPNGRRDKAIRLLQFLAFSVRPPTIEEAVDVIATPLSGQFDVKNRLPCPGEITRICSSLVSVGTGQSGQRELELAHFSVKEYLTSTCAKPPEPFQCVFSEEVAEEHITRRCIAYLSCLSQEDSAAEIIQQFPLAEYSAQYWTDHAQIAEASTGVVETILDFFANETACSIWRRLLNRDRPWDDNPTPKACPLYYASQNGLYVTVQRLFENGLDINAQGGFYGTALQTASYFGYDRIVDTLLAKGADINAQGGYYGTALQAASYGYNRIVDILLAKGADINAQGGYYGTALQTASSFGHDRIVDTLLAKGADINAQGGHFGTALQAASFSGNDRVIDTLLANGADVNAQGGYYGTALQAASSMDHDEIVDALLANGADINAQVDNRETALLQSSSRGHFKTVKLLLDSGADPAVASNRGSTPLHRASGNGHIEVVKLFLERSLKDVVCLDNDERTPLFDAARGGHGGVVRQLLDCGLFPTDAKDKYGSTALFVAMRNYHVEAVELLVAAQDSCLNSKDGFGRSLLWYAKQAEHGQLTQILHRRAETLNISLVDDDDSPTTTHAPTPFNRHLRWCDACMRCIGDRSAYHHCEDCDGGDFDLCVECVEQGIRCRDGSHVLVFRPLLMNE